MGRTVIALVVAAVLAAPATAFTPQTRDAPWRLTGLRPDGRTLHLVYEGGGCLRPDGAAVVDTSAPDRVRIAVRQTVDTPSGEDEACTLELGFVPLDITLETPLAGRRVTGGPRFAAIFPAQAMPALIGLRRADAVAALRGQGVSPRLLGRRSGVVHDQVPEAGRPRPKQAVLVVGPFDPRARLQVTVPAQSVESVLRRGLRYAYSVDPGVERALDADLSCDGQDAGTENLPTRGALGSAAVEIGSVRARRRLRRRRQTTCRLHVRSYPADLRSPSDWLLLRTTTVTLRHR